MTMIRDVIGPVTTKHTILKSTASIQWMFFFPEKRHLFCEYVKNPPCKEMFYLGVIAKYQITIPCNISQSILFVCK